MAKQTLKSRSRKTASRPAPKSASKARANKRSGPDPRAALVDAMLDLAGKRDWNRITLADIAARAGLAPEEARRACRTREQVVAAFMQRIDDTLAKNAGALDFAPEDTPRDRLFDLFTRRLDLLEPHRRAVANIHAACRLRPWTALCLAGPGRRSMERLLRLSDMGGGEPPAKTDSSRAALARIPARKALAVGLLAGWAVLIVPAWIHDESPDRARTMAKLDQFLSRIDPFLRASDGDFPGGLSGGAARA